MKTIQKPFPICFLSVFLILFRERQAPLGACREREWSLILITGGVINWSYGLAESLLRSSTRAAHVAAAVSALLALFLLLLRQWLRHQHRSLR